MYRLLYTGTLSSGISENLQQRQSSLNSGDKTGNVFLNGVFLQRKSWHIGFTLGYHHKVINFRYGPAFIIFISTLIYLPQFLKQIIA